MVLLGTCGASGGFANFATDRVESPQQVAASAEPFAAAAQSLGHAFALSAWRRPVAFMSGLASLLILFAAFRIAARSESARWWTLQSLVAKGAVAAAEFVLQLYTLQGFRPQLDTLLAAMPEAARSELLLTGLVGTLVSLFALYAALLIGLGYWAFRELTRDSF